MDLAVCFARRIFAALHQFEGEGNSKGAGAENDPCCFERRRLNFAAKDIGDDASMRSFIGAYAT